MNPLILPTALKALPWRAIGAISLVVAVAVMGWRVTVWRDGYQRLQATEKALARSKQELRLCTDFKAAAAQVARAAEERAAAQAARDKATAERIQRELKTTLAAADARGRDLARRLQDARAGASSVPAATDPARGAAGPAGDAGRDEALGGVFAACLRDAERLRLAGEWWAGVEAGRRP
jgi:hypothetical protein